MRVGFGYDVHKFADKRNLWLGGVHIPNSAGLLGHSDADVLVHAIIDALLGAAALGDIGKHFPDTDPAFKDISSIRLLEITVEKLINKGFSIVNIDSTVVLQAPKIAKYIPKMCREIAEACGIDVSKVNVKATTEENMGFTGMNQGMKAYAICMIS